MILNNVFSVQGTIQSIALNQNLRLSDLLKCCCEQTNSVTNKIALSKAVLHLESLMIRLFNNKVMNRKKI